MADFSIDAYISNLGKYTEGEPTGEWVRFPTTAEEIQRLFERIGIDGENYGEVHITECNSQITGLDAHLGEYERLDALNYLAARISDLSPEETEKFTAAVQHGEHANDTTELINLTYNLGCFELYPVHNAEEYGRYLVDELGTLTLSNEISRYFDFEAYGNDTVINEGGEFTNAGYIYNNRSHFEEIYTGLEVPQEYRVASFPQPELTAEAAADLVGERDRALRDIGEEQLEPPTPFDIGYNPNIDYDAIPAAVLPAQEQAAPLPVKVIDLESSSPADKLKEITDKLESGIAGIFESEQYQDYLKTLSKFHNYSLNNTILIAMQKPDATHVAGFTSWKNQFERNVVKGQKGIKILAPSPFKLKKEMEKIDPNTQRPITGKDGKPVTEEVEITIPAFKVVSVFDVSQTEGKELPNIGVEALTGDVEKYQDFFAALEKASPVPIGFEEIESGAKGYYNYEDKRIALQEGMSELQTLKTTIHEIAHARLHDVDTNTEQEQPRADRHTREVEAESVAYTVCQHYGLDTSDYSFGYVAGWSSGKELTELKDSLETIRSTAAELITEIDGHFAELQQDRQQTAEQEQPADIEMPDPTISVEEMQEYGYSWDGMLPLQEAAAMHFYENESVEIFRIYEDNTEGAVESVEDLRDHAERSGIFGIEKNTFAIVQNRNAAEQEQQSDIEEWSEPATAENVPEAPGVPSDDISEYLTQEQDEGDTFSIYQLKLGEETRGYHYESFDRLQTAGLPFKPENYNHIYTGDLIEGESLEGIFEQFNIATPEDFMGNSLSVSDVVTLNRDGKETAHYVDSFGFREVPEFLQPIVTQELSQQNEPEASVKYYSINETAARRAKEMNSFYEYKPGSATAEYHQSVDKAAEIAERQKAHVDPSFHAKIDGLLDTYARKLAQNMNNSFAIEARVPSVMIAGPANFPVRQKEKQNAARDKNMGEWQNIQGLLDKIRSVGTGGISADDPNAIPKLQDNLAGLEKSQKNMKAVNAYYRKNKTLDGCPHLSTEQIQKLTADMANRWHGRVATQPYEPYKLINNNADINRIKSRIEELTQRSNTDYPDWQFNGGTVKSNTQDNRLQILFDEKPDADLRTELKRNGFKWSPTAGAWQRQLNHNAFFAANGIAAIQPLTGERPTDLERKARLAAQPAQPPQPTTELPAPDNSLTGEKIKTPRGSFSLTDLTKEQMEAAGYGVHHSSDDNKYHIMANGTQAFAIANELNPLRTAEMSTEQNYNMIDGIPNNTPTVDELEQQVKAGQTISLLDLAEAVKNERSNPQKKDTDKKPSILAQLAEYKAAAAEPKKAAAKTKSNELEV